MKTFYITIKKEMYKNFKNTEIIKEFTKKLLIKIETELSRTQLSKLPGVLEIRLTKERNINKVKQYQFLRKFRNQRVIK
jgi:hypothetical protein